MVCFIVMDGGTRSEEAGSRWDFRENEKTLCYYSALEGVSLPWQDNEHTFSLGVKLTIHRPTCTWDS